MELNQKEVTGGMSWLLGAGTAAVLLLAFLIYVDHGLRHSDGEKVLGDTLRELRTAQSSLPSEVSDERQTMPSLHSSRGAHDEGSKHNSHDIESAEH